MANLLVVDDNEEALEVYKDILESSGHFVLAANSGEMALGRLHENQIDLALVDLKMEGMSGLDVMKTIQERYPDVIVIVLTGHASLDYAVEALRLGAYDFLQKDISPELLVKKIEQGLEKKQLRDLSEAVIQKMNEGIALLDAEEHIFFTNEHLPHILEYSREELQGKPLLSIVAPEDESGVIQCLKKARKGDPQRLQTSLIRKDGTELIAITSFTKIGGSILIVVSDVTKILGVPETAEDFSYNVSPGHVYLVEEEELEKAMEAFLDLVKAGYKGTIVTRKHLNEIQTKWGIEVPVLRFTEELSGECALFPDAGLIEKRLEPFFSRNRVVLIDRLDYLVSRTSFASVLNLVQRIRDLVFARRGIALLSVDPRTLKDRELSLLEKETWPLLPVSRPELREDLVELLSYVAKRNEVGVKPHHKEIEKKFSITRTTARQRLMLLLEKGLIVEKRKGRLKVVQTTERGRKIISMHG